MRRSAAMELIGPMALTVLIVLPLLACIPASEASNDLPSGSPRNLTVFAAISLNEAFAEIATVFEQEMPGVSVDMALAGSQRLRTQLEHGARGDVFASADQNQMDLAEASGILRGDAVVFATNRLAVIVPKGEPPGRITEFEDLANQGIKLALALPDVPAGRYARQMLSGLEEAESPPDNQLAHKILANVVTSEPNVRGVATKVALGEVDAGVVYTTDATARYVRDRVRVISIPEMSNVAAAYPIAPLRGAKDLRLADEFIRFVLSSRGQSILGSHGFSPSANP